MGVDCIHFELLAECMIVFCVANLPLSPTPIYECVYEMLFGIQICGKDQGGR